jgi:hypothetical protein
LKNYGYIKKDNLLHPNITKQTMAKEEVELFIVAIVLTVIFSFWLGLCHTIYLVYCQRCCEQHSFENNSERTQATFYVTKERPEMSEGDEEGRHYSIVFIKSDSNIN